MGNRDIFNSVVGCCGNVLFKTRFSIGASVYVEDDLPGHRCSSVGMSIPDSLVLMVGLRVYILPQGTMLLGKNVWQEVLNMHLMSIWSLP